MYVGLSKEHEALRDELRAYYDELLTPEVEDDLRKGEGVGQVSKELELTETALRAWVQRADIDEKKDPAGPLTSDERAEVTRLRRELRTVTMERDFLRKAAAFFARSGK